MDMQFTKGLKMKTRRLASGKCQVQFTVSARQKDDWYGYIIAEPKESLREVVGKIEYGVKKLLQKDPFYGMQSHLYDLGKENQVGYRRIFLFKNKQVA
jgi:hypothetical protein